VGLLTGRSREVYRRKNCLKTKGRPETGTGVYPSFIGRGTEKKGSEKHAVEEKKRRAAWHREKRKEKLLSHHPKEPSLENEGKTDLRLRKKTKKGREGNREASAVAEEGASRLGLVLSRRGKELHLS